MSNRSLSDRYASTFYGSDATVGHRLDGTESLARFYDRLADYNRGVWTGRNRTDRTVARQNDTDSIFDTVASWLELTDYQTERSRLVFNRLDLAKLSTPGGIDTYVCAFFVAVIVCREDGRFFHPNRSDNDALFVEVAENLEIDDELARSAYLKILDEVEL
jgi:hypothetical protein